MSAASGEPLAAAPGGAGQPLARWRLWVLLVALVAGLVERFDQRTLDDLAEMIEADEAQAAEILKRWLLREAA